MRLVRLLIVLLTAGTLALSLGSAIVVTHLHTGPVYSLAQIQTELADHPHAWVGRTVLVRGVAEPCPWWGQTARLRQCADQPLVLVPAPADPRANPLPLRQQAPTQLLALLRGLPLLHDLVSPSPAVLVFRPARFRVHVHTLAASACGGRSTCYEALLDAAPGAF